MSNPNYVIYSREPQTSRQVKILLQSSGSTPIYAGFYTTHINSKVTQEIMPVGSVSARWGYRRIGSASLMESNSAGNLELYILDLSGVDLGAINPETIPSQQITHNEVDERQPGLLSRWETDCVCLGTDGRLRGGSSGAASDL